MSTDYGYGCKNGSHTWSKTVAEAFGQQQSPINIFTRSSKFDGSLSRLEFKFKQNVEQKVVRKAHNFQVSLEEAQSVVLSGGPVSGTYDIAQFHFHWGASRRWGSEHTVDGLAFASELHLVFVNSKYGSVTAATKHADGLAVVGVFLQVHGEEHSGMKAVCKALNNVAIGETKSINEPVSISSFLPSDLSRYYTYPGSLTTPPCSECVTWIVMADPVYISSDQLRSLRATHEGCDACKTCENFRHVFPLGDRVVRSSFKKDSRS